MQDLAVSCGVFSVDVLWKLLVWINKEISFREEPYLTDFAEDISRHDGMFIEFTQSKRIFSSYLWNTASIDSFIWLLAMILFDIMGYCFVYDKIVVTGNRGINLDISSFR